MKVVVNDRAANSLSLGVTVACIRSSIDMFDDDETSRHLSQKTPKTDRYTCI